MSEVQCEAIRKHYFKPSYLNLEAHSVVVVRALRHDGNDTQSVCEACPVLLVVGDLQLKLRSRLYSLTHAVNGDFVDRLDISRWVSHLPVGDLQEAAVSSKYFVHGVAGKLAERIGGVDDGTVGLL